MNGYEQSWPWAPITVHVKTRDLKQTMQLYVDNLGATLIADMGACGYRVNLHGL